MSSFSLWLRWSWRDLRRRWPQIAAIAAMLAIGTGMFAALTSTGSWRRESIVASIELAGMHDLKVRLATGTTASAGSLVELVEGVDDGAVSSAEERLVWPTQFEVVSGSESVLVPGELVGAGSRAVIDRTLLRDGADPADPNAGLLEYKFAAARELPESGTLTFSGGTRLVYTGRALSPEYYWLVGQNGIGIGQGNQATWFGGLARVQELADRPGQVNDLVLALAPGSDREALRSRLDSALTSAGFAATITTQEEEPAYRLLFDDIDSDQRIWNLISVLVLGGASFAAFNLVSRIVEAQRREIGIGMALGVTPQRLAVRPLLVGAQIALLGVLAGVGVGLLFTAAMRSLLDMILPLPVWHTPLDPARFAAAAALGFALPTVATVIPVWRAVRVQPVDAIRSGHGASGRRGWARLGSGLRWPRRSLHQYPVRNLLRVPRRTILTATAVAAALTVLIAVFGMLDSFEQTIRKADAELSHSAPERIDVQLARFEPADGPTLTAIAAAPEVARVDPGIVLTASVAHGTVEPLDLIVQVLDASSAPWSPSVRTGTPPSSTAGIVLADKALKDLDVAIGDTVTLQHPRREGMSYTMVETDLRVAGTHRLPLRTLAYLDASQADLFGLTGIANAAQILPERGVTNEALQSALFRIDGVASALPVGEIGDVWDEELARYTTILRLVQGATLALALLIAFNTSSISVDERAREHATMFAFGVRRGGVLAMDVVESAVIGVLGALGGIGGGYLVMWWLFRSLLPQTIPEVGIEAYLAPTTGTLLFVLAVIVVGLAPLLNARRLRRMDIPATLRVVE